MTLELPSPLAPWAVLLGRFPADVGQGLGGWLPRLSAAFGRFHAAAQGSGGAPDGYAGLTRRGPYERLLPGEWALAAELPEEFLRRASMGEHSFYALAEKQPRRARRCFALVDAGPEQLGTPRIAQLAVLIVLAQRARAAGATFFWGVLQESGQGANEELSAAAWAKALEARTGQGVEEEQLDAWCSRFGLEPREDELWLVGGPRMSSLPSARRHARVEILDRAEPGVHRLRVQIGKAGARPTSLELELPAPELCTRLIRDPFGSAGGSPTSPEEPLDPSAGFLFTEAYDLVIALLARGALLARRFGIGDDARATRVFVPPVGERILAAGSEHPRVMIATTRGHDIVLYQLGRKGRLVGAPQVFTPAAPEHAVAPRPDVSPLRPLIRVGRGPASRLVLTDGEGRLVDLIRGGAYRRSWRLHALSRVDSHAVAISREIQWGGGVGHVALLTPEDVRAGPGCERPGPGPLCAVFGHRRGGHPELGFLGLCCGTDRWTVHHSGGVIELVPPSGTEVVGVATQKSLGSPGLVVVEDDRRTFSFLSRNEAERLFAAPGEVLFAQTSTAAPLLGVLTVNGDLLVYSLRRRQVLLHRRGRRK